MATTKAITANAIKNNGATVFYGGNVPSTSRVVTNVLGLTAAGYRSGKHGSVVPNSVSYGVYPVNNTGNFAKMTVGKYVTMKQATELAGLATTKLLFGANADVRLSINKVESMRTSFLSGWSFSASSEAGARVSYTYSNKNLSFGNDDAARPTRAIPGELTYNKGASTPTNDDYKAKTG